MDYLVLKHHGVQGQKWGIRRYQNEDGSLTDEGRKRYGSYGSNVKQYDLYLKDQLKGKNKDEATEILKSETKKQRSDFKTAVGLGMAAVAGGYGAMTYGAMTANPLVLKLGYYAVSGSQINMTMSAYQFSGKTRSIKNYMKEYDIDKKQINKK